MKRCIAVILIILMLLPCSVSAQAADPPEPIYLVDMVDAGLVGGDLTEGIYRRSGCQREYASTGIPSGTPAGAVWIGKTDGSAYREFHNGFRFHSQGYVTRLDFTMPEGYNTFSGTVGMCWHIDAENVGYNNKTVASVYVGGALVWRSGPMKIQHGFDFCVNAPSGSEISVRVDSVDGNTAYGHVCFGDPVITYDPDYYPVDVSISSRRAQAGQPLTVTLNTEKPDIKPEYIWSVDGSTIDNAGDSYTPTDGDLEKTVGCAVVDSKSGSLLGTASAFCSKLPVLYIETDDGAAVTSKDTYKTATMHLTGDGEADKIQYDGAIQIKGRGNATWGMPKKPYHIKLESKADLLGMGAAKHWLLIANYQDECLLRNKLSCDLSIEMGLCGMSSRWVDVIINGECVGNYLLFEQVRIGKTRVNITEWEDIAGDVAKAVYKANPDAVDRDALEDQLVSDLGWVSSGKFRYNGTEYTLSDYYKDPLPDINGGYLLEMDRYNDEPSAFFTSRGLLIKISRPEFAVTNSEMTSYISEYVQALENACYAPNRYTEYNGEQVHYSDLADVDSMIKWWLVEEVFFNWDAGYNSNYMYKDTDGKLVFGPIWDMDLTAGGYYTSYIYDQWQTWYYTRDGIQNIWFKQLVSDPYFLIKAQEYYWEYRDLFGKLITDMDDYYEYLKESGQKNSQLWYNQRGFEDDFKIMREWFANRLSWLDTQFATEASLRSSLSRYLADGRIAVEVKTADGESLPPDTAVSAPASALVTGSAVSLEVSAPGESTEVYLNGRLYSTLDTSVGSAVQIIPTGDLIPNEGSKAVVSFYSYRGDILLGQNYLTLAVAPAERIGITIDSLPSKTVYDWGCELDTAGLAVSELLTYGEGKKITEYTLSGYDPETPGVQTVTVTAGEFTAQFEVTVKERVPAALSVSAVKTVYERDHVFTKDDFTVTVSYEGGRELTADEFEIEALLNGDSWEITLTADGLSEKIILDAVPEIIPDVVIPGDVDDNKVVNVSDIVTLKGLIMAGKWSEKQLKAGDIDKNGTLNVSDMLAVKNIIMTS